MLDSSSELESLANSIKFNSAPRLQGNCRRRDREMAQRSCKTEGGFRSNDLEVFAPNRLQFGSWKAAIAVRSRLKTRKSERQIPMRPIVLVALRKVRELRPGGPDDLVFATRTKKPLSDGNLLKRYVYPACERGDFSTVKSKRSDRDLPLGSVALETLKNWRSKSKGGPEDLVFATRTGKPMSCKRKDSP